MYIYNGMCNRAILYITDCHSHTQFGKLDELSATGLFWTEQIVTRTLFGKPDELSATGLLILDLTEIVTRTLNSVNSMNYLQPGYLGSNKSSLANSMYYQQGILCLI